MPLSPGDKLGPYEILSPIGAGGIQPLIRTTGVIVDSMNRQKAALPQGQRRPYDTLALVQQLLGNDFKSWIAATLPLFFIIVGTDFANGMLGRL
ncbi:MAG: hypothetical protein WCE51_11895 [Chthoniobacterales bacterium]